MDPIRSRQGSRRREAVRTVTAALSAGLFIATVWAALSWHGPLLDWIGGDVTRVALIAAVVVVDTVLILSLISLGVVRDSRPQLGYVPIRGDERTRRRQR